VTARRRRLSASAASGSAHIAYQGSSHAVDASRASVAQPAIARQSAPRAVRHSAIPKTSRSPAKNRSRHQPGTPLSPTSRAVSAGMLCVATSCCCSFSASRKPNAWVPKPTTATTASATSAPQAAPATPARSRQWRGASTTNGKSRPAETFTPTPTTSTAAEARSRRTPPVVRGLRPISAVPAASASAAEITSSTSVSLWAPPAANSSRTGFRPTNAAAALAERPILLAALAVKATAARLVVSATAFSAHKPPASPSGANGYVASVKRGPYGEC
jgi:hypothetical protein